MASAEPEQVAAPLIFERMLAIFNEIEAIKKGRHTNARGGGENYNFRGIDDVMAALHPLMAKHQVFAPPTVLERIPEERTSRSNNSLWVMHLRIRYDFYTIDGSSVAATVWGEAMDSSDKATNKATSAAMKYAFLQTFCIPTDDLEDADATSEPAVSGRRRSGSPSHAQADGVPVCPLCDEPISNSPAVRNPDPNGPKFVHKSCKKKAAQTAPDSPESGSDSSASSEEPKEEPTAQGQPCEACGESPCECGPGFTDPDVPNT